MKRTSIGKFTMAVFAVMLCTVTTTLAQEDVGASTRLAGVMNGRAPASVSELKALQNRIQELREQILGATVAIQVGRANGSGVIVSRDGYVLTAAHVAGTPGRSATIVLSDDQVTYGTTLGLNQQLDAGVIKITQKRDWPFAPLGRSAKLQEGQWCLATGHPGGFDRDRAPVLRWGRVLKAESAAILTDCTLVGGDSGGPLFDLNGNVIGIHSRIGKNLTINVHVPVDPFRDSWTRFVNSEVWGMLEPARQGWLGVTEDKKAKAATVSGVIPKSPADMAGLKRGDVIMRVNDARVKTFGDLQSEIRQHRPNDEVELQVQRGNKIKRLSLQLTERPGPSRN